MEKRNFIQYLIVTLKGMAMGAADVVPGVSGGTIAFISGIYEELITSINNVDLSLFKTLKEQGLKSAWNQLNGNFLLALFIGIGISVLSLAKLVSWLLENKPILIWSFFFGLVIASILLVGKEVKKWNATTIFFLILGACVAYYITILPPSGSVDSLPFLFLSGALAICAMILPGISGAFILVLLGSYKTIIDAVHNMDIKVIAVVGAGAIFGLLSFAKLLKWMFNNHKNLTLALLTGFIIGSLNKIWPWKRVLETRTIGEKIITIDENVSPFSFQGDNQLVIAIIAALVGFLLIFLLERTAAKKE
ncbi:DUF368 domain-containing protein [Cytophaga sp. FL35]|uniref:DUF368 domain-containing protein n=1 Tax=Cytophaga sp. FL35 TaxID=1904456 RepID=UPI001653954D|nr:DUF368 domain-containing protein [Cytophaga sp. FL35]MBC6997888.1 DUF368 domain-containing protein [Cytophaga sp. FL35]